MTPHPSTPEPSSPQPGRTVQAGFRSTWTLVGAGLLIGLAGLFLFDRSSSASGPPDTPGAIPVVAMTVDVVDRFSVTDRLVGRLISRRRSELGFERGGRLAEVLVDDGARVSAGQLLARLDTRELEAALREQKARLASTRARLELARVTASRQRRLEAQGTLSSQALDESLSNEATLEAQVAAEEAARERTEVALELSRLHAPYDAIVVRRRLDEGSVAGAGASVLSIIEAGVREVQIGAPPEVAAALDPERAYVVENGDLEIEARLTHVLPELDPMTRTQTVVFEIDDLARGVDRLADGALVWVRVERTLPGRGTWVPIGALTEGRRGTWTVFAVVEDDEGTSRIERRVVEIVQSGEQRAFVRGTLEDGDRIVADGLHRLIPGFAVTVVAERTLASEI